MARTLTTGNSVDDASQFTTAAITPSAKALVLVFVTNTRPLFAFGTLATPRIAGNGLAWEMVNTVTTEDGDRRLTCFRSMGAAPTNGPLTIDFADQIQDLCAWSVFEYTGVDTSGVDGAGAIAQSRSATGNGNSLTARLTPSDPAHNLTVGGITLELVNEATHTVSAGTGFREIHQQTQSQPFSKGATLQTQEADSGLASVGWTWTGTENAAAIAVEVKGEPMTSGGPTTPAGDPVEALIRRFEPVLFLHPAESFFPVDAKRYVENSALWAVGSAFDDKNNWGGSPGASFPRSPLVPAGGLAAMSNELGQFLGRPNFIVDGPADERVLELGGWKDKNQAHEAEVTATTTNQYADRAKIFGRYDSDLAASKFWYHAEVFETARLSALAASVHAPDLKSTLSQVKNPVLLCYYFFFPAHEQSVGADSCPNVEAKEVACHAGDWHCVALLLEGDGTGAPDSFTPKYFGHTGSRPTATTVGGKTQFRPYAFDGEGRTAMKVEPWRTGSAAVPAQPDVVGDHPQFYVARGSHSFYTTPGTHEVSPYDAENSPIGCGKFDTDSVVPPSPPSVGSDVKITLTVLLKTLVGGLLGAIFTGYVAGLIEAIIIASTPFGAAPSGDPPNPDVTPSAEDGLTVRPAGLPIPGHNDRLNDWGCRQGLIVNNRTYDFVVDRGTQIWWPSDDGTKGFRGRWGQRVTSDPLSRRAGPRFPEFWKMFLTALESGFSEGTLTRPHP